MQKQFSKRRNLWVPILILSLLTGCVTKNQNIFQPEGKVVITGKILNYIPLENNKTVLVRVGSILKSLQNKDVFFLDIDPVSGDFGIEFEKPYEGEVVFDYGKLRYQIIAMPGDSIHLTFDHKDIVEWKTSGPLPASFEIHSRKSKLNSEIAGFFKQHSFSEFYPSFIEIKNQTSEVYLDELRDVIKAKKQLIDHYVSQEGTSDQLYNYLYNNIIYNTANLILDFKFMNGKNYSNKVLYDFSVFPLDNPDAMICSYYNVFIQNYLDDLIGSDTTIQNLNNEGKHPEKHKLIFEKINELPIGSLIKDVYISIYLDKLMNDDFRTFLKLYADIKPGIENENIATAIDNDLSQRLDQLHTNSGKKLESGDEVLKSLLSEINTKLNSDYYLIDVWGLGCAPCIAAMPKMYTLKEELKPLNTSIVFLCTPGDSTRWNKTTERFGPYAGHFMLNRQEWDHIRKKLSFSSVPRYFMIDRNGNIPYENISGLDKNHLEDLINNLRI